MRHWISRCQSVRRQLSFQMRVFSFIWTPKLSVWGFLCEVKTITNWLKFHTTSNAEGWIQGYWYDFANKGWDALQTPCSDELIPNLSQWDVKKTCIIFWNVQTCENGDFFTCDFLTLEALVHTLWKGESICGAELNCGCILLHLKQ